MSKTDNLLKPAKPEIKDEVLVLTIPETAKLLGISAWQAYRMAKTGTIPSIKLGGCIKVSKVALERFLEGDSAA
jgi:excisionase family DNA binding protein